MWQKIWIALAVLGAMALHRYAQSCGLGLTYDSENYLWASRTWFLKGILENRDGVLFLQQPPLFPLLLSLLGLQSLASISWFNTLCLGLTVGLWGYVGKIFIPSKVFLGFYLGLLACATPLLLVHQFLWSEAFFLALLSLHFLALYQYQQGRQGVWLAVMLVASALFCLQRSIGIAFVLGTFLSLLPAKETRKASFIYVLSCLPFLLWLVAVLQYKTPTEFAQTYGVQTDILGGLQMLVESFALWFLPAQVLLVGKILFCALFVFVVGKIFILRAGESFFRAIVYSLVLYSSVLILKKSDFSDTERFVAVLYPFCLWLLFCALPASPRPKIAFVWTFCLLLASVYPVARCMKNVIFWKEVQCRKHLSGNI